MSQVLGLPKKKKIWNPNGNWIHHHLSLFSSSFFHNVIFIDISIPYISNIYIKFNVGITFPTHLVYTVYLGLTQPPPHPITLFQ